MSGVAALTGCLGRTVRGCNVRKIAVCRDCDRQRQIAGRGLCARCYKNRRLSGTLPKVSLLQRPYGLKGKALANWITSQCSQKDSGCQVWKGSRNSAGYPRIGYLGETWLGNRLLWHLLYGSIPEGLSVCHRCDNPSCLNPAHFFLGTHRENMSDKVKKNRQGPRLHGEKNPLSKLTDAQRYEIQRRYAG